MSTISTETIIAAQGWDYADWVEMQIEIFERFQGLFRLMREGNWYDAGQRKHRVSKNLVDSRRLAASAV